MVCDKCRLLEVVKDEGQAGQNSAHHPLESRTSILPQNKGHTNELKESKRSNDGGIRNVVREHLDLVVALHKVKGGASHVVAEC